MQLFLNGCVKSCVILKCVQRLKADTWANCEALFDFETDVKARLLVPVTPHDSGLISEARQGRPVCTHIPHIVRGGRKE